MYRALTWDRFHAKGEQIYHVCQTHPAWKGKAITSTSGDLGPEMVATLPAVLRSVRTEDTSGLLSYGDQVSGTTILMYAARGGDAEVMRLLLDNGADTDINAQNNNGRTALMFASDFGFSGGEGGVEVVRLLLANGADINARDNDGRTAVNAPSPLPGRQSVSSNPIFNKGVDFMQPFIACLIGLVLNVGVIAEPLVEGHAYRPGCQQSECRCSYSI